MWAQRLVCPRRLCATVSCGQIIVFRLRPQTAVPHQPTSHFSLAHRTTVTTVPVEEQFTEHTIVEPTCEPYEAGRREARLALAFRDFRAAQGHGVTRLQIQPEGEAKPIFSDLYVESTGLLVEVKGSVALIQSAGVGLYWQEGDRFEKP
jgi:hypothetical protein